MERSRDAWTAEQVWQLIPWVCDMQPPPPTVLTVLHQGKKSHGDVSIPDHMFEDMTHYTSWQPVKHKYAE